MPHLSAFRSFSVRIDPILFLPNLESVVFPVVSVPANPRAFTTGVSVDYGSEVVAQQISLSLIPHSYTVRSLRMFVDVNSIAGPPPVIPNLGDSDEQTFARYNAQSMQYPRFYCEILRKEGQVMVQTGAVFLQNRRPGYYVNLLRFLTARTEFRADLATEISIRITDAGFGVPQPNDIITLYGETELMYYHADTHNLL